MFPPFGLSEGSCGSLNHVKPFSVLWMQRNGSLSIFLDEQFNLFIHINFTYPLLPAKLYLQ